MRSSTRATSVATTTTAATVIAATLGLVLGGCGVVGVPGESVGGSASAGGDTADESPRGAGRESASGNGVADEPVGPGCSDFPPEGPGSLDDMADQPFATAIADSPVLGRLSDALERAGLSEVMDAAEGITVFAPVNDAFDMYPDGEMDDLMEDPDRLAYVLNYHVVAATVPSGELDGGVFDTLNGGQVRSSASDGAHTVDDYSPVVCTDLRTANATVHVVNMLLIPS